MLPSRQGAAALGIVLSLTLCFPVHAQAEEAAEREVTEILSDPKYRFCNDPNYRLFQEQKDAYCDTASESESVCPGLLAACARPAWEEEDDEEKQADSSFSFRLPAFLAPIFQLLFWAALALGLGFLLWNAWKVARSQSVDFGSQPERKLPARPESLPAHHALGFSREEFMEKARQAASLGRYQDALLYLYQATLQGLADQGWLRLRKSATSGDYSRAMRARLRGNEKGDIGPVDEVELAISHLRALESERFAQQESEAETLEFIKKTQTLFHRWGSTLIILTAWFAQGCEQQGFIETPNDTTSPGGTLLFEELIARHAESSQRRFRQVESVDDDTTVVVIMGGNLEQPEWDALDSWVQEGGELVALGSPGRFAETFGVNLSVKTCEDELITAEARVSAQAEWHAFDQLEGDESYFLCGEHPIIVGMTYGEGWLTMIATPALVRNARLAEAEHAELVLDSLLIEDAHVELLGPWTGRGSSSPLQSMLRGNFGWWVLHILIFFAVAAWGLGRRFGHPSEPSPPHRRAFVEHALALAGQYQQARAHAFMLQRFFDWSSERLRHAGTAGANTRRLLSSEYSKELSSLSTSSAPAQMNLYQKLRDALGRRSAAPSPAKKKD